MDYRRLAYFLAIVDTGTLTAAAERLHLAQPTLSRQMKVMERELRMELFQPQSNRLVLTRRGQEFVGVARRLLTETRNAERSVEALRTGMIDTLTVAATVTTIYTVLGPFIAAGGHDLLLLTRATPHFSIYDALDGDIDIAVSPAPAQPGLHSLHLGNIPIRAWVDHDHVWAAEGRTEISIPELAERHLILPSHQSVSRYIFDEAVAVSTVGFQRLAECDDNPTIIALASAGQGIGISTSLSGGGAHPMFVRTGHHDAVTDENFLKLPLQMAWRPGHFADSTIQGIAARLRAFVRDELIPNSGS